MRRSLERFLPLMACVAFVSVLATAAHVQEWPSRPLTIVVGTAAGGGSDLLARIFGARLAEVLGRPVVIENVGNAVAAAKRVATAPPNGYVLNFGFASTHALHA